MNIKDRKNKKLRTGVVVSDKMDRTAIINVERKIKHPLYSRVVRLSKRYQFHDQDNDCKVGDLVRIIECRAISKHKKWRFLNKVNKNTI